MSDSGKSIGTAEEVPLWRLLDSPIVEILVGSDKTRWPLPERLLTHHSATFASAFGNDGSSSDDNEPKKPQKSKNSYTLPDEENEPFQQLVQYLFSSKVHAPTSEQAIGPLLDLYLLALKLKMSKLATSIVDAVREWYHASRTYPGLRRVQYIYANTDEDNEMREMVVSAVARQLTLGEKIPAHWAMALQRNGQLAVDIIRAIQQWHIEEESIPDVRDGSSDRGRKAKGGFSAIERAGDSVETMESGMADSAIGLESRDGDAEDTKHKFGNSNAETDGNLRNIREVAAEADTITLADLKSILVPSLAAPHANIKPPPKQLHSEQRKRRRKRISFAMDLDNPKQPPSPIAEGDESLDPLTTSQGSIHVTSIAGAIWNRKEAALLGFLWVIYILTLVTQSLFPSTDTHQT